MGLTAPSEHGIAKGQLFFFVSHDQPSASRLPYHPEGVVSHPKGCDNETFKMRTRV